ncbi:substrate-binding periplasmic protein [Aquipseudomonas ullengensis]|uniref:Transporter substrate-binding domain-containing protein n=1 Tax=Aquipseudomonas ullengensis TaxID=2759166 RepID=A0A7W4LNE7_9GAMM|nr:transporter substrate-binding domain-containing protein [Pseudomonas ullengensis]MBB2496362.1 transporter substrate-binding domain-containing protein [Pseudomonas ullengensis]
MTTTLAIAGLLLAMASGMARASEPLNIYVGQGQMPYADDTPGNHGLFGDLMEALCLHLQRECHYQSVPWKRVQLEMARDPHGIVLNLGRTAEREAGFIWLLDVLPSAYVLAGREKSFDSLQQALDAGPVVVMGGTPRALELQGLKQPGQAVVEVTDPAQAAGMLRSGRVRSWYEIDLRVRYLWRELGFPADAVQIGKAISVTHSFIAGSPVLQDAPVIQQQMQQGFAAMRQDGSWQRILARYLGDEAAAQILRDMP